MIDAFLGAFSLLAAQPGPLALEPCDVEGISRPVLCGTLDVPLDHGAPERTTISLNIVIVRADPDTTSAGALTLLTGGPGTAATNALPGMLRQYDRATQTLDIVLVDQRGTGRSAPLHCYRPADRDDPRNYTLEAIQPCEDPAILDYDPRFFGTTAAAHDLDRVRSALGYRTLTIVGRSYGTRLAQDYARRYPEFTRALLLKGVVPPQGNLSESLAPQAERMLRSVFALCAADAGCSSRFENLDAQWERALDNLADGAAGRVRLSPGAEEYEVHVSRGLALSALRSQLYAVPGMARLPLTVEQLAAGIDDDFVGRVVGHKRSLNELIADGMYLATTCAEDIAFVDVDAARTAAEGTFLGAYRVDIQQEACETWPAMPLEPDFKQALAADIPILALNGELDPATWPEWAEAALAAAPNARLIRVPNRSHALVDDAAGCLARLENDFLMQPDPHAIDAGCVETIEFPPFVLDSEEAG